MGVELVVGGSLFSLSVFEPVCCPLLFELGLRLTDKVLPLELSVGHVIQGAIAEGLTIQSVSFPRRKYLDIGSPEGLRETTDFIRRRGVSV